MIHRCWLAYISDDFPTDSVHRAHPISREADTEGLTMSASLDHTIWFHRPFRVDQWMLFEIDSPADSEQLEKLVEITERYCVIYRTLADPPAVSTQIRILTD